MYSTLQSQNVDGVLTAGCAAVEDLPPGYPRFAALLGCHPSFHVCRRFLGLRARLLLHKQDSLAVLESQLNRIDRDERRLLFLGNLRRDTNDERRNVLRQIDLELADYGNSNSS